MPPVAKAHIDEKLLSHMTAFVLSDISLPASWIIPSACVEAVSILVIIIGCWGEGWAERHHAREWCKRLFWRLVVGGLAVEFMAFGVSFWASNIEIARLTRQNIELRAKLLPRRINPDQMKNFALLTQHIEKIPIKIAALGWGTETLTYAHDLREMFANAGFPTNTDVDHQGINVFAANIAHEFGWTNSFADVIFVNENTNTPFFIESLSYRAVRTNGLECPVITATDEPTVYQALQICFRQNGIKYSKLGFPQFVQPGHRLILVPEKEY
jgi:hypothetical protein